MAVLVMMLSGGISEFTNQQIHDTLKFVNGATATDLDSCIGIDPWEANRLSNAHPFTGIGTILLDEVSGEVTGHIDSVSNITDLVGDNDLVHLRNCAPVSTECEVIEATGPNCIDGLDNDSDGFIDAADFDCHPMPQKRAPRLGPLVAEAV